MDYLLDTHILLWAVSQPGKLSVKHKKRIDAPENRIFVSWFSYMEISIKAKLGKLPDFKTDIEALYTHVEKKGMYNLDLKVSYINYYQNLPLMPEHRDPFDRFIISSAIVEKMKVLTVMLSFSFIKPLLKFCKGYGIALHLFILICFYTLLS